MFDLLYSTDIYKQKKFWAVLTVVVLTIILFIFTFMIPLGYQVNVVDNGRVYQYQELSKDDLDVKELWVRIPFDNQPTIDNYQIGYADYQDLNTNEYIKKYQMDKPQTAGEQIVMGDEKGEFTIITKRGKTFKTEIPVVKAVSAVAGYDGNCHVGDVLDESKIYLDVKYEDGSEKRFTDALFRVLDTEDFVLKPGFNDFTVSYAGVVFPLSVSCTDTTQK